jgi:hypothetical protein
MDAVAQRYHDALENTKLAQGLANGTVSGPDYRVYLRSMLVIWESLEEREPWTKELGVRERLEQDLALCPPDLFEDESVPVRAQLHAATANYHDAYVLGLGLCFGGKQMARNLSKRGLPVRHFRMPRGAVRKLREIETTSSGIASAFHQTLAWYNDVT